MSQIAPSDFVSVVVNGMQVVRSQLPAPHQLCSSVVEAGEVIASDEGRGVSLDLLTVVSLAPVDTFSWRLTLGVRFMNGNGVLEQLQHPVEAPEKAWGRTQAGLYVPGVPVEYELVAEQIPVEAKLEVSEARMIDAVITILQDSRYNAGGGSLSTVSLDNRLRHLPHFADIMDKHGGMWRFLNTRPDVLKIWKLEVREGEKKVQKRDYRVYLASMSWEEVQAADTARAASEREAETGLRDALAELLKDGPKMQQDVLSLLKDCRYFTQHLLPTQALLKRFISLHRNIFFWEVEVDQPIHIGLNKLFRKTLNDDTESVTMQTPSQAESVDDVRCSTSVRSTASSMSSPLLSPSDSGLSQQWGPSGDSINSKASTRSTDSVRAYRHDPYSSHWVVYCAA